MDVTSKDQGVTFSVNQAASIAALEQDSYPIVPFVEISCVGRLQIVQGFIEIGREGLQEEMKMVIQKTVAEKADSKLSHHLGQKLEEDSSVLIVQHDGPFLNASVKDVVVSSSKEDPWGPRHVIFNLQQFLSNIN